MKYRFKRKPMAHQVEALKKLLINDWGGALLMEPRTGKTKVAVDFLAIKFIRKEIDRVFIVCPKHVMDVWLEQFALDFPYSYRTFVWDARHRRMSLNLPDPPTDSLLVVLTNFEAFSRPGRKVKSATGRITRSRNSGRIKIRNQVRKWASTKTCMVVDEGHRIGGTGPTSSVIASLSQDIPYRILMTGTAITKSSKPQNVWYEWKWLNPSRFSAWDDVGGFKDHFAFWADIPDVPIPVWKRSKNFGELKDLMLEDSYSQARDECLDLPSSDDQFIDAPLIGKAAKAYDDMAEHMIADVEEYRELVKENRERKAEGLTPHIVEAPIGLVKVLRLAQIASGHVKTDRGVLVEIGREKLHAALPVVSTGLDNGEKIVIAARFKADLDSLYASLRRMNGRSLRIHQIRGGMSRDQVSREIALARTYKGPLVYIVQPRAGSLGIDLSFCSRMVWFSLTPSFVDYTQCCDRIALSRVSTTFTYIFSAGIDRLLYEVLQGDGQVAKAIVSSPERLMRDA